MSPLFLLLAAAARAEPLAEDVLLADLGLHVVGVGYQRTVTPALAAQVAVASYTPWTQNIDLFGLAGAATKGDTTGVLLRVRGYVFPLGRAPTGPWISPFVQAGVGWATADGAREMGPLWAGGSSVGYAGLVGQRLYLSFGLGAQYHAAAYPGGPGAPSFARLYPTLDGAVGYAF